MARTGRYEEEALHKACLGANRPRVQAFKKQPCTASEKLPSCHYEVFQSDSKVACCDMRKKREMMKMQIIE
jgi:hypothetical protein